MNIPGVMEIRLPSLDINVSINNFLFNKPVCMESGELG
jgi:hypothetical protein